MRRSGERADFGGVELCEENRKRGARENREMERGSGGSAESFWGEGAGSVALAGSGSDGRSGSESGGGAKDGADVAGILNASENDDKWSGARECRAEDVVEGKLARLDESGHALGMFGVGDSFKKALGGVENRESDFRAVEIGSEAGVMATAGFGEENSSDAAAGGEGFLGEAGTFDPDEAGFGGEPTAEGDAKFLEPAIVTTGDHGVRGTRGFAWGGHDGEGSKFEGRVARARPVPVMSFIAWA